MLSKHIKSKLSSHINAEVSKSQEQLIEVLADFLMETTEDALLLITGYAGTGKTTVIGALVGMLDEIKLKSFLLAPTGRAAKVLSSYAGKQAYTIHKKIYRQRSSRDGFGHFDLDKNLHTRTLFIVDEASMLAAEVQKNAVFGTGSLLDDLMEYVYNEKGCKLILVGDTAQLPPVGLSMSPALEPATLRHYSDTLFKQELIDVVRQKDTSGILENATGIRQKIQINDFSIPFLKANPEDFIRVSGEELIEKIGDSYDMCGIDETIIISRSNKRANIFNEGVRNSILWREEELVPGDLLMVVRNNYFWFKEDQEFDFIANGDILEVVKIHKYQDIYGFRFADCTIRLLDYNIEIDTKLLLDVLHDESPALNSEKNRELFYTILEDYADLKPKKKQYEGVRNNEFFNALQVKYAYAITCHKSQGGQWKSVFIDQGYITEERMDVDYFRWLYTAITRATEKVYLVNFPDYLFEEST